MNVFANCDRLIIGCGYLGRRVANRWRDNGDRVVALTRSEARALELRSSGIEPVLGDVTDAASLSQLPAAETLLYAVGLDRASGRSLRDVYVTGLARLLESLPAPPRRLIYVSSTSVYGQNAGEWVDETSETTPLSDNGRICLEAEQLLRTMFPPAIVVRSAGIYGPGRLVARIDALRQGRLIEGRPQAWLNLIHVDDLAAAVMTCGTSAAPGTLWLASDNQPCQRRDYYRLVARLAGAPEPVFVEQTAETGDAGLNKRCSNLRIRDELGLELQYPTIVEGVPAALETRFRLENPL